MQDRVQTADCCRSVQVRCASPVCRYPIVHARSHSTRTLRCKPQAARASWPLTSLL